jgi:selenocysteine lyase/cysteine desulfurase
MIPKLKYFIFSVKMHSRRKFFKLSSSALGLISIPSMSLGPVDNNIEFDKHVDLSDPFERIRSQLLVPNERAYLNTGSLGPSPRPVIDAVMNTVEKLEANPVSENWGELGKKMESVRSEIGAFINAPTEGIILTRNTTEGLSLIGQTIHLEQGDEILTTTREHKGGEVGFEFIAHRDGAKIRKIELPMPAQSVNEIVKTIESALTEKTKILVLSHVNTITGMKMPFEEFSSLTRDRNIWLIVDGAQAPGLINVDVTKLGVDAYASSGHKWLLGPKETGFLYLSQKLQKQFNPVFTSYGYGSYSASSGTRNVAQFIGLSKSIEIQNEIGPLVIEKKCLEMAKYCRDRLSDIKDLTIISPTHADLQTGIVSVKLEQAVNSEVSEKLKEKDIIVKTLAGINALRFSCHLFISKKDIDRLVFELKKILA